MQVFKALKYMHTAELLHRDIKVSRCFYLHLRRAAALMDRGLRYAAQKQLHGQAASL